MKKIKEKVLEILEIVKECPENLREICFKSLLEYYLQSQSEIAPSKATTKSNTQAEPEQEPEGTKGEGEQSQDDLAEKDLHLKAKRFLQKNTLSIEHLNQLFYKEGDEIKPLYDDLKTTRSSESQIRVALLKSLLSAIKTGEFQFNVEEVRQECNVRKCYDSANFGKNFNNNIALFDIEKYEKGVANVKLTEGGKEELANVIKKLQ